MRVKESGKIMETKPIKAKMPKSKGSFVEGSKQNAKLPKKPPKKEKY